MTRATRKLAAVSMALALLTAACGSGSADEAGGQSDSATSTDGTLIVGSVASTTGSAAPYGLSQDAGTTFAVEREGSGSPVPLRLERDDDASDPRTGTDVFNRLIGSGVSAILGPTLSPVAAVTDPLAQAVGVPVLAVTNTTLDIDAIGDLVWRVSLSENAMIPQTLSAARDLRGVRSAVLLEDSTDDYSQGAAAAFRQGAERVDIALVEDRSFDPADLDPAGWRQLVAGAAATGADALLFAARSDPATQLLLAAQAESVTATLIGGNGFNAPEVISAAGSAANGLLVAASWNPAINVAASEDFVTAYTQRFGEAPDAFAAQGYAGVQILIAATRAGGGTSRQAIARGLNELGEVETVLGTLRFVNREAVYPAAVQEIRDGRLELVARGTP